MKKVMKDEILARLIDGCVLRIARYQYACAGDGTPNLQVRRYSPECVNSILKRSKYIEFEPQPHSAGSRHCLPCAEVFFARKDAMGEIVQGKYVVVAVDGRFWSGAAWFQEYPEARTYVTVLVARDEMRRHGISSGWSVISDYGLESERVVFHADSKHGIGGR